MIDSRPVLMHIIDDKTDNVINRVRVSAIPRCGDIVRLGGEGNEKFYKVILVVWVYDEPENPLERVNIGVVEEV